MDTYSDFWTDKVPDTIVCGADGQWLDWYSMSTIGCQIKIAGKYNGYEDVSKVQAWERQGLVVFRETSPAEGWSTPYWEQVERCEDCTLQEKLIHAP